MPWGGSEIQAFPIQLCCQWTQPMSWVRVQISDEIRSLQYHLNVLLASVHRVQTSHSINGVSFRLCRVPLTLPSSKAAQCVRCMSTPPSDSTRRWWWRRQVSIARQDQGCRSVSYKLYWKTSDGISHLSPRKAHLVIPSPRTALGVPHCFPLRGVCASCSPRGSAWCEWPTFSPDDALACLVRQ